MRTTFFALSVLLLTVSISPVLAQSEADPEDVASPEAIILAAYESFSRPPGEEIDWDRFRSLFLPGAILIPSTEQRGGSLDVITTEGFIEWVDDFYEQNAPIGGPDDQGFVENEISSVIQRYGDVAQVFSTYQKHYWEQDEILGRGINSFQLVYNADRWWIVGVAWDEEIGAGPIPEAYLP